MNRSQIYILLFSIVLLLDTALNIYYDINLVRWAYVVAWIGNCLNVVAAILAIIAVSCNLGPKFYQISLIILVLSDLISLLLFFFANIFGRFYFIKIANLAIITSLIALIQLYIKRLSFIQQVAQNGDQQMYEQVDQQQPLYQNENEPNASPIDIQQPQNAPNITPSGYEKPHLDIQPINEATAPPPDFQQNQCYPVLEPNSKPS